MLFGRMRGGMREGLERKGEGMGRIGRKEEVREGEDCKKGGGEREGEDCKEGGGERGGVLCCVYDHV